MRNVEIKVYCLAFSSTHVAEFDQWLRDHGVSDPIGITEGASTESEEIIGMAAKRCYLSFEEGLNPNVTQVRKNWHDFFQNLLASGHGSVLEHVTYTWAIEGVSRVFTGEMNRHRVGVAISEGSMRFIRFDDIPWWLPNYLRIEKGDDEGLADLKIKTQDEFNHIFREVEGAYKSLCKLWDIDSLPMNEKKKLTSLFRRIIPMGVATGGVWTMNLRALRHIIALRASPGAEEEIAHVMNLIIKRMIEMEPEFFGDFKQDENGFWVPEFRKV